MKLRNNTVIGAAVALGLLGMTTGAPTDLVAVTGANPPSLFEAVFSQPAQQQGGGGNPVLEPGEWAFYGILSLGVVGLVYHARVRGGRARWAKTA